MNDAEVLQKAYSISEFVKGSEDLMHAVWTADQVWRVINGAEPARTLLSALKGANYVAYWTILQDLAYYIERETNHKLVPVDPPPVPGPQVNPRDVAIGIVSGWAKGTFAEGTESELLQRCAVKLDEPEADLIERMAAGRLDGLEAAYEEVMEDARRQMA